MIRFQPRDRRPAATLGLDDLAVGERADGEVIELVRAQETELPQALKWQVLNAEEDYDAMTVEARRATGEALRVTSESFAIATIASDADRRCRRALLEEWVGRETASFRLPPSRLALDPGDVVQLDHDGRLTSLRLTSTADAGARVDRGGAHRRRRLRAGAGTRAGAAGAEARGLRTAERGVPRPAAAPRERARRTSRSLPSTPCPGRAGSRSGAARARTASSSSPRSAGRRAWERSSPISIPGRRRASTSATSPSSISPSARSRASPTSRSSAAPTRWRSRRRPASGRCCSSASPS